MRPTVKSENNSLVKCEKMGRNGGVFEFMILRERSQTLLRKTFDMLTTVDGLARCAGNEKPLSPKWFLTKIEGTPDAIPLSTPHCQEVFLVYNVVHTFVLPISPDFGVR